MTKPKQRGAARDGKAKDTILNAEYTSELPIVRIVTAIYIDIISFLNGSKNLVKSSATINITKITKKKGSDNWASGRLTSSRQNIDPLGPKRHRNNKFIREPESSYASRSIVKDSSEGIVTLMVNFKDLMNRP